MNPSADRYAVVLWALREHHRRTKTWHATAEQIASLLPLSDDPFTDPTRSVSRTLTGMVDAGLVHSSRRTGLETRARRLENDPNHAPYGAERWINQPSRYFSTNLGDLVNDMLDLVGSRADLGTEVSS